MTTVTPAAASSRVVRSSDRAEHVILQLGQENSTRLRRSPSNSGRARTMRTASIDASTVPQRVQVTRTEAMTLSVTAPFKHAPRRDAAHREGSFHP